jgi:mRNA-degrading endonuclease toxin of MazEF toxin-antitoxin module
MMNQMGYGKSALKVNQRDIVLIKFPSSDLSGAKVRPALVISNQGYNIKSPDTVVLALTSDYFLAVSAWLNLGLHAHGSFKNEGRRKASSRGDGIG